MVIFLTIYEKGQNIENFSFDIFKTYEDYNFKHMPMLTIHVSVIYIDKVLKKWHDIV